MDNLLFPFIPHIAWKEYIFPIKPSYLTSVVTLFPVDVKDLLPTMIYW